ncbi:MAG TPA: hypothetical protein VFF73_32640 [Planctomycetota bacterium]|nr:hypothetical protein [Planctomycetota bacterium]
MRALWLCLLGGLVALGLATASSGCSSSHHHGFVIAPIISNINGSTTPTSSPGATIQINGSDFGSSPGHVNFAQNGTTSTAQVASGNWTNNTILAVVPTSLTAPGTVAVSVVAQTGAVSSSVNLQLVPAGTFTPAGITFTPQAQALPSGLRAASAVAVPGATGTAFLVVIGGNTGTANVSSVIVANIASTGAVGSFTATNDLPTTVAFAAVTEADETNAPVAHGTEYVYVIGGQQNATDAPGGTSTVYLGTVSTQTGQITWTTTTSLPETRVGAAAVTYNGFIYVTGGLGSTGTPIAATAVAPVKPDGTLGAWVENAQGNLPQPVAFHGSFASAGFLYVLGGNTSSDTTPYATTAVAPTAAVWMAPINGTNVGPWTQTGSLVAPREKFVTFASNGSVAVYEGATTGTATEGEASTITSNGQLAAFTPLSGAQVPNLNVVNASGATSPLLTSSNAVVILIVGGDQVAKPGTPTTAVPAGT